MGNAVSYIILALGSLGVGVGASFAADAARTSDKKKTEMATAITGVISAFLLFLTIGIMVASRKSNVGSALTSIAEAAPAIDAGLIILMILMAVIAILQIYAFYLAYKDDFKDLSILKIKMNKIFLLSVISAIIGFIGFIVSIAGVILI